MPPKQKVTRNMIVDTAITLVRTQGHDVVNARSIAAALGCSTQPVFSNFDSMDQLKLAVIEEADSIFRQHMQRQIEMDKYPPYKASGMAYILFAMEEPELFKLLYMRQRSQETFQSQTVTDAAIEGLAHAGSGLNGDDLSLFHFEMWAFVHGIAVLAATGYTKFEEELISRMLTDCFQGLKHRHGKG